VRSWVDRVPAGNRSLSRLAQIVEQSAMASMHYAMDVPSQDGHTLDVDGFRVHGALPEKMKRLSAGARCSRTAAGGPRRPR